MSKALNAAPQRRKSRTPLGQRNRLALANRDDNYQYRVVNANMDSDPDRVARFKENDWEIAPERVAGSPSVDTPSAMGSEISVGKGVKAVLMRIRKEWYEEDQAEKAKLADNQESGIYKDADQKGLRGKLQIQR
jgi:hypothetical protein